MPMDISFTEADEEFPQASPPNEVPVDLDDDLENPMITPSLSIRSALASSVKQEKTKKQVKQPLPWSFANGPPVEPPPLLGVDPKEACKTESVKGSAAQMDFRSFLMDEIAELMQRLLEGHDRAAKGLSVGGSQARRKGKTVGFMEKRDSDVSDQSSSTLDSLVDDSSNGSCSSSIHSMEKGTSCGVPEEQMGQKKYSFNPGRTSLLPSNTPESPGSGCQGMRGSALSRSSYLRVSPTPSINSRISGVGHYASQNGSNQPSNRGSMLSMPSGSNPRSSGKSMRGSIKSMRSMRGSVRSVAAGALTKIFQKKAEGGAEQEAGMENADDLEQAALAVRAPAGARNLSTSSEFFMAGDFEVIACWKKVRRKSPPPLKETNSDSKIRSWSAYDARRLDETEKGRASYHPSNLRRCSVNNMVFHPTSNKLLLWNAFCMIVIALDLVILPLTFFGLSMPLAVDWIVRCFWTLNMLVSCITGYDCPNGSVELRPARIVSRFARTWLLFELPMVVLSWLELAVNSKRNSVQMLRIFGAVRYFRVREDAGFMNRFGHKFSESMVTILKLCEVLVCIFAVVHVVGCFWFLVSDETKVADTEGWQSGWLAHYGLEDLPPLQKYLHAYRWSLGKLTGSAEGIHPHNKEEIFYSTIMVLTFFIIRGWFLSSITTSMMRLHNLSAQKTRQFKVLSCFLRENQISSKLVSRVHRNAQFSLEDSSRHLTEKKVDLLNLISEPLRVELHFEMHCPTLMKHPFLLKYSEVSPAGMRKLCHVAVSVMTVHLGDVIFAAGTACAGFMMFLTEGLLHYQKQFEEEEDAIDVVCINDWMCEATLWTKWSHIGDLIAAQHSRLMLLKADEFQRTVKLFPGDKFHPEMYANMFVDNMKNLDRWDLTDLQDQRFMLDEMVQDSSDAKIPHRNAYIHKDGAIDKKCRKTMLARFIHRMDSMV